VFSPAREREGAAVRDLTLLAGLLGLLLVFCIVLKMGAERAGLPALVGYILLGFVVRLLDHAWGLPAETAGILDFLGLFGVVFLLFGVGLKTDLGGLRAVLGSAGWIWVGNVLASGGLGYLAARYLLETGVTTGLMVGVALTATSVGVTVGVWDSRGKLASREGEVLLDVAELDDVSAVVLMAILFAVLPTLQGTAPGDPLGTALRTAGFFTLKALLFGAICFLLARYAEGRITSFLDREGGPDRTVAVSGIGLGIAALAGMLGFSMAIGAFFAGLVFSTDPRSIRDETSFESLHDLFVPFFFLGLGFKVDPAALGGALVPAALLLVVAVVGKVVGTSLPALGIMGGSSALLLGVSMVPRAEISMIVMERGLTMGEGIVSPALFGAMVLVTLLTSTLFPVLMSWGLGRQDPD
jgi:Kef-type K+ transport system membrane component KefB